jgi:DNA-binding CsgD family transcriptional regulator
VSKETNAGVPRLGDLRALVDRSPVTTLVFGLPDQRVRIANKAVAELIGCPQSAIVGLRPAQVWDGDDGRRSHMALSGLTIGALDSFRARRQLHTGRGPVAVSVWVRRVQVVGGYVAVVIVVPFTSPKLGARSVGAFFEPEAIGLGGALGDGDLPPGPDAERIATFERHLVDLAVELHAGGWLDAQPPTVDPSWFATLDELPMRQREIVDLLLRGERIPSIAASMFISASTVRNHLSHVFTAVGVHSQAELLALLRSNADGHHA